MPDFDRLTVDVPVIETERLRLRGHRVADLTACEAIWSDPVVTRYLGSRPISVEEVWARLLRYVGHWALQGFGFWALEEKVSGRFIGDLGFMDSKRGINRLDGVPEIGWVLAAEAHGKGYGTEAVRAAVEWGDAHFSAGRTACIIHPDNRASVRVAEKCGYYEAGLVRYKERPVKVYFRER
jgi:RimJ/RimL family protein N-acetyltransferase